MHAEEAATAGVLPRWSSDAVVGDLEEVAALVVAGDHAHGGRLRMAHDIGERFLGDAIKRKLHGRTRQGLDHVAHVDRDALGRDRRREPGEPREIWLWHERSAGVGPSLGSEDPEHRTHLVEGGLARFFDARKGRLGLLRLLIHQMQSHTGLHIDLAERMGEHVM